MGQVLCTDVEKAQGGLDLFVVHVLHVPGIRRMLLTSRPGDQPRQALSVRAPGVEPGPQAWGACMMPLHYVHWWQCASGEVRHAAAMRRTPRNAWLPRRDAWNWGTLRALTWRRPKARFSFFWCICPMWQVSAGCCRPPAQVLSLGRPCKCARRESNPGHKHGGLV